jgi:hypothetical protein
VTVTLAQHYGVTATITAKRADPLRFFRFAVPRLRDAFNLFTSHDPISELSLRACNKGGKTLTKAMYVMACLQKRKELDGVVLPQWRGPVQGLQSVLDYPQQLMSVKPAYLRALGDWPAEVHRDGQYLKYIRVMPIGGNEIDHTDWSEIQFGSQKNMDLGRGARTDIIDLDEPHKLDVIDELRKAGHAGRRSIRVFGFTPLKRMEWAGLRQDYGDTPRRTLRRVDQYRAECRWSLDEVPTWVLSDAEKLELRTLWQNKALSDAREHGDYENTEGKCPFDDVTIMRMVEAWCEEPTIQHVRIQVEGSDGVPATVERVAVEVFHAPRRGRTYYQCIDPASGIDDNAHNPLCIHLSDDETGELCVRWNGYLDPHKVGKLAAVLHRHYNGAWTDIEMKDHWGVNVLMGYEQGGGGALCYEQRELRPGVFAKEVGFDVVNETRAIWVGAIQEWIASFKAGMGYARCASRAVLECLLDTELDDRGRIVAGPGIAHGEDFILRGQTLRRIRQPEAEAREVYVPQASPEEVTAQANRELARLIMSGDEDEAEALEPLERPGW